MADARVDDGVEQVDDEVGDDHADDEDGGDRLDDEEVVPLDREHETVTDALRAEERLGDDRAADQRRRSEVPRS